MSAGVVACGHEAVADAAATVLRAGGNAFDACVAAGFAGAVAEPCFTGLAGGGFLLAHTAAGDNVLFDFFVDTPGLGLPDGHSRAPHFLPVEVQFVAALQVFHVGAGSVAVPGCLAGYLHVHERLGRLSLTDVVRPAVVLAREGAIVDATHAEVLNLLAPVLTREPDAAAIAAPSGTVLGEGDRLVNRDLADFIEQIGRDGANASFYRGELARALAARMDAGDGLVTVDDLAHYGVIEREPLAVEYRGTTLLTNPPPSFGGSLIALALSLDEEQGASAPWMSSEAATRAVDVMIEVDQRRATGASKGTTQMTVADADGNVASMTTSNGETSGDVVPGTGVLLNNMLGEDDLHPDGFHAAAAGERVPSMMAPTVVLDPDGRAVLALGSGGSKRIRTAIAHVVRAVVAHGVDLGDAVASPRLHWDGEFVQAEPGYGDAVLSSLRRRWPVNEWPAPNLYFGGVHAVRPGVGGAGDRRRGGATRIVPV